MSWLEIGTAAAAAVGGGRAIVEYIRVGRWKAAELASAQSSALVDNDVLDFACQAIDWGSGPLAVPQRYKPLVKQNFIEHDVSVMQRALRPTLNIETLHSPLGLLYRHALDRLFGHIDRVGYMVERSLFDTDDIEPVRYYLDQIYDYKYAKPPETACSVFLPFVESFEYKGLMKLRATIEKNKNMPYMLKLLSRL